MTLVSARKMGSKRRWADDETEAFDRPLGRGPLPPANAHHLRPPILPSSPSAFPLPALKHGRYALLLPGCQLCLSLCSAGECGGGGGGDGVVRTSGRFLALTLLPFHLLPPSSRQSSALAPVQSYTGGWKITVGNLSRQGESTTSDGRREGEQAGDRGRDRAWLTPALVWFQSQRRLPPQPLFHHRSVCSR